MDYKTWDLSLVHRSLWVFRVLMNSYVLNNHVIIYIIFAGNLAMPDSWLYMTWLCYCIHNIILGLLNITICSINISDMCQLNTQITLNVSVEWRIYTILMKQWICFYMSIFHMDKIHINLFCSHPTTCINVEMFQFFH